MTTTPLELALSYAAQGWPVFPVRSVESADPQTGEIMSEKSPLTTRGFRDATTTTRIINARWATHPDAAIGIPTGEKIGAWVLDLDVKQNANGHEWLAAMEDVHGALPYSARVRTANGGTHIYFNHCDGVRNRGKLGAGVDVRGEGGFVLAPGSVLDGGREYMWLDDTGPDDIVDAPAWLLDLVLPPKYEDTPGNYTYTQGTNDRYVMRAVEAELHALACMPPGNRNNELNDAAFALGQFVGAGALDRGYVEGELIAIASQWPNLGKSKGTIKSGLDAGIKRPRNIPERPQEIDFANLDAIRELIERSDPRKVDAPTIAPIELSEDIVAAHAAEDEPEEAPQVVFKTPDSLTDVPGLVGDIAKWLGETARNPSPILNLGASLAYVGALAGRRYEGPTGLRTNVYIVGLAPSGFGKEHPRAGIKALAGASETLKKFFGGNKIASSSGLRNRVKANPTLVYMIDEFGGFMRKVTSAKSGNHEKEIAEDLLEMTGTASSVFMGADYAQNLAEPIFNPNVCIFGTSTPDAFWKALGSGSIMDGFLPRFIVLDAGTERPRPRHPAKRVSLPPKELKARVQALVVHRNGGDLNGMAGEGSKAVVPVPVVWGRGAQRVFDAFVNEMFAIMDKADTEHEPVYARVAENAMRIATIVAVGVDPERPELTADIMQWAQEVARQSCKMLLEQAERYVADNDRQAEYKLVRNIVGEGKRAGMKRSYLLKRLNGRLDRRRGEDVVNLLIDAEEIVDVIVASPNGGRKVSTLYLSKYAPRPAEELKEAA